MTKPLSPRTIAARDRYRRVLFLRDVAGITFKSIGDELGVSTNRAQQLYKLAQQHKEDGKL